MEFSVHFAMKALFTHHASGNLKARHRVQERKGVCPLCLGEIDDCVEFIGVEMVQSNEPPPCRRPAQAVHLAASVHKRYCLNWIPQCSGKGELDYSARLE